MPASSVAAVPSPVLRPRGAGSQGKMALAVALKGPAGAVLVLLLWLPWSCCLCGNRVNLSSTKRGFELPPASSSTPPMESHAPSNSKAAPPPGRDAAGLRASPLGSPSRLDPCRWRGQSGLGPSPRGPGALESGVGAWCSVRRLDQHGCRTRDQGRVGVFRHGNEMVQADDCFAGDQ